MSIDIDNAVYARWNAASLNSTLAELNPGEDVPAPEGTVLPRANYYSPRDATTVESRGTNCHEKEYVFQFWTDEHETAANAVKSIEGALLNSENSTSNALQIAQSLGEIMATHPLDQMVEKHDDGTFLGEYRMLVRWRKAKAIPA